MKLGSGEFQLTFTNCALLFIIKRDSQILFALWEIIRFLKLYQQHF